MNRYDVEIIRADDHETDLRRWVTLAEVTRLLSTLQDGDDMLVHHVGSAEPELEYG